MERNKLGGHGSKKVVRHVIQQVKQILAALKGCQDSSPQMVSKTTLMENSCDDG